MFIQHECGHIVSLQSKRDGVADISTTDVYAKSLWAIQMFNNITKRPKTRHIHVNLTEAKWRSFSIRRHTYTLTGTGCRTCTARAVGLHSLTAVAHSKRNLVSPILSTAWQTWGIYWDVYCTMHEQVWTNLLRTRTSLFQNWTYITEEQIAKLRILNEKYN